MTPSARPRAAGIITMGRLQSLEAEGLRVVGMCEGCRHYREINPRDAVLPVLASGECMAADVNGINWVVTPDFGCTEWEAKEERE